jgi:hypothetical protein
VNPANLHKTVLVFSLLFGRTLALASNPSPSEAQAGTSNDLFIMFGSDFVRPGLAPKANYNIGLGHTFTFLKKDPFGDELTFGYTYENAGSHGFPRTTFGSHTEALEITKNFGLPKTKPLTGYTWIQAGITSIPYGFRKCSIKSRRYPGTQQQVLAAPEVGDAAARASGFVIGHITDFC